MSFSRRVLHNGHLVALLATLAFAPAAASEQMQPVDVLLPGSAYQCSQTTTDNEAFRLDSPPLPIDNVSHLDGSPEPSVVSVDRFADGSFSYVVNGVPQLFAGMGYNPVYRHLVDGDREARYRHDFAILKEAGVNHIIGWDSDKGYEQDKFDEITLNVAHEYGIGVVMPFYLPATGDYYDETFLLGLMLLAQEKIARYKGHPALRMWGVGNEVLNDMQDDDQRTAFLSFYPHIADLFRRLDPNHPVIYREAEDSWVPRIVAHWRADGDPRPWLLYGMNFYTMRLAEALAFWPSHQTGLPLFVTEFGAEPNDYQTRAQGYVNMWRMIRSQPSYVLGGAPYTWWAEGPEPTDTIWGLMDVSSRPVDETFERLVAEWQSDA